MCIRDRAFIILSAGFSEENAEGKALEKQIVETIDSVGGALIGPNCIGVLTTNYNGVFTTPIPKLDPKGVDFVSGSGATALFIMDAGMQKLSLIHILEMMFLKATESKAIVAMACRVKNQPRV